MKLFDHYWTCLSCGHKIHEDKMMPNKTLVAKDDGDNWLVQPGRSINEDPDLPPGARIVETWDHSAES